MRKIIWLIIYALIALIIPFTLLAFFNGWIAIISLVVIMLVAYKFQDSLAKIPKRIVNKYIRATSRLLPIQRKLLLVMIISGVLFFITNTMALIQFNLIFNDSRQLAVVYGERNFMLPKPPFDTSSIAGKEYIIFTRAFERGELGFYSGWSWYTDEVFLTGLIFVLSLLSFLMSVIISRVISEKANPK